MQPGSVAEPKSDHLCVLRSKIPDSNEAGSYLECALGYSQRPDLAKPSTSKLFLLFGFLRRIFRRKAQSQSWLGQSADSGLDCMSHLPAATPLSLLLQCPEHPLYALCITRINATQHSILSARPAMKRSLSALGPRIDYP
jgi:hypothetical protein